MATSWMPLAVALVTSGSRGNKLLFYHSGISTSHSLESELLNKLPQRTLAEILASCPVMQDKKFELRVDNWKFVGHPFLVHTSVFTASFNIAFVLQSQCTPEVVKSYDSLSRVLGVALIHEEHRAEFFKNQVTLLLQIADQVDSINELSEKAVSSSSLAKTLWQVLCGLQKSDPHVHVLMNSQSEISTLIDTELAVLPTIRHKTIVRSYSAVILLSSIEELTQRLPSTCNPSFYRFITTISPVKSLIRVSLDADIPLQQAIKFAHHLVHWGQAITVYPLSETNVYINSSLADTKRDGQLAVAFKEEFPSEEETFTLPQVLFHFSSPITLAEMRDLYPDEKLIPIVTWLLKHEQIIQLHTYIYLVPPENILEGVVSQDDVSVDKVTLSQELRNCLSKNLSEEEIGWVESTDAAFDTEDMELFTRLCCYLHGKHHLEEILMLENMTRSQLLSLIDKFSEILTTASLPEHN